MFEHWANDKKGRVSTAWGVVDDGTVFQGFDPKFFGYAIYVQSKYNRIPKQYKTKAQDNFLNRHSIQVEICNFGGLTEIDGKFYAWPAKGKAISKYEIPEERVMYYPDGFRGYHAFEKYTDQEVATIKFLAQYVNQKFGIPLHYNEDMWDISENALKGAAGIYSHVSFRTDKSDCHPQPNLIRALQSVRPRKLFPGIDIIKAVDPTLATRSKRVK